MICKRKKKKKIYFSIVIATKNSGKVLQNCLDSLKLQTYKSFEVIIIDGKSNDNTMSIVDANSSDISFFSSEEDHGIYDAWNKALEVVKYDWIMFLGSDDILLPKTLDIYCKYLRTHNNSEFVSSKIKIYDSDSKKSRIYGNKYNWNILKKYMNFAHVGAIHNRKIFKKFGKFNTSFKVCGDYEFFLRSGDSLNVGFLNEITCCMKAGGASQQLFALKEAFLVKKLHDVRPKLFLYLDYYVAINKYFFRKLFR